MPSTILSDNGVSSGSAGLKTIAASDGSLALQTTTAGGTATTAVTIDTSQNVGLGVTPSAWYSTYKGLDVNAWGGLGASSTLVGLYGNAYFSSAANYKYKTSAAATMYLQDGTHSWHVAASGTAGNAISFTQAMTLNASGSLLLNTTSTPTYGGAGSILLNNATAVDLEFNISNTLTGYIYAQSSNFQIGSATSIPLVFLTGNSERARIDSSGNFYIGGTSFNGKLAVQSSTAAFNNPTLMLSNSWSGDVGYAGLYLIKADNNTTTSQVLVRFAINGNAAGQGQINANGANACAFGSFSDARLKENIVDLPSQLDKIMALRPVEFDYIESEGGGHQTGFIAQEMQEVYPDAVGVREPDQMLTVTGWNKTEAILVKAIQELKTIVDAQAAEIAALKGTQP